MLPFANREIRDIVATSATVLSLLLSACSQSPAVGSASDLPQTAYYPRDNYVIGSGDQISVHLTYNPSFDQVVEVHPDGRIALPMIGSVLAAGRTTEALTQEIAHDYGTYLQRPDVVLTLKNNGSQRILVGGEVVRAGSMALEPGTTISDAITAAGGFKDSADVDDVLLFRRDKSGQPHAYRVNVANISSGKDMSQDIPLQPRDHVFVPRSGLANVNLFMKHVFRDNMPINIGAGLGM